MVINRICISINNRCNLNCKYCHFHEKQQAIVETEMNVFVIFDHVIQAVENKDCQVFKIGFVGNGEPLLDYELLK